LRPVAGEPGSEPESSTSESPWSSVMATSGRLMGEALLTGASDGTARACVLSHSKSRSLRLSADALRAATARSSAAASGTGCGDSGALPQEHRTMGAWAREGCDRAGWGALRVGVEGGDAGAELTRLLRSTREDDRDGGADE